MAKLKKVILAKFGKLPKPVRYILAALAGVCISFLITFGFVFIYAMYWGFRLRGDSSAKIDALIYSSAFDWGSNILMIACVVIAVCLMYWRERKYGKS